MCSPDVDPHVCKLKVGIRCLIHVYALIWEERMVVFGVFLKQGVFVGSN